jgi:putative ABC transport system permease protein
MFVALWQVANRQWRTHRLRVALTTAGIALGVGVYFSIATANAALLDSLALTVERLAGKATLQVVAGDSGFPEQILDVIRATPGVQAAEPVIEVVAHTAYPDDGNLLVLGIDVAGDQQLRQFDFDHSKSELADPLTFLAQPNSILLSRSFAAHYGLRVGERLPLFTTRGRQEFIVQGLFAPTGAAEVFGGNIAIMDVYSAQTVFGRGHSFDRIDLLNAPGTAVDELQAGLRARLSAGLEVVRPRVRGEELEQAVTAIRLGMSINSFIALLVGVYIIFNAFTIAVNQRWKEIGILRALGVPRAAVNAMFLGEALLVGVIGSMCGIAGGFLAAIVTSKVLSGVAASIYGVTATAVAPALDPSLALESLALGLAASLAGAWFPARAASRLDPILALHNIEIRQREAALGWKRLLPGAALVLISSLLVAFAPARVGVPIQLSFAVFMLLGLTLMMPVLVHWAARLLRPAMDLVGGSEGALAADSMIQSPRRSAATVGALMIGLMLVFSTGAYIQSYRHMIDRWSDAMLNSDLFVSTSATLHSTSYHFSEDLGRRIGALPEVERLENVRFTLIPYRGETATIVAIEMDGFLARAAKAITGGDPQAARDLLPRGKGLVVSRNFAARWGTRVGEPLHLDTPTGALDLPVVGIVDDYRSDKGSIFMDRALYKSKWQDAAVDVIDVSLKPGASVAAAKVHIRAITSGSEHALVYTNGEFRARIANLVDQFFLLIYMQLVVAVFVAILGIANTLIISVSERRQDFGILRAVGGLRSQVRKLVLLEAVAISIVGVLVGALAALFDIQFMSHTVSTVLVGYSVPFVFPWLLILQILPAVMAVSLLAAWLPARSAARMQVIDAIGYE